MQEQNRAIIIASFLFLKEHKGYKQTNIVNKLITLGVRISTPTFSRIINKHAVSPEILLAVSRAIQELVEKELGYRFDETFLDVRTLDWQEEIIPESTGILDAANGFTFYQDGRLHIEEKVAFFSTAKKEMIEFGVTLNAFSNYFYGRKDIAFRQPILEMLERGVVLKCYLLNPNCRQADIYFRDRAFLFSDEKGIEKIKSSIARLQAVQKEIADFQLKGRMEIYTYQHVPNNYFLAIDGGGHSGKMMVSHYLFGERRANCPVLAFAKKDNKVLFQLYRKSLLTMMKGAKLVSTQ